MSDVLEAQLRSNRTQTTQSDSPMTKVDRSTYAGFSNKLSKGTPNQYWVERFIDKIRIHVYPTPCLLYTSPSPRDGLLSRMPSSA